jgi:hypothetical protein
VPPFNSRVRAAALLLDSAISATRRAAMGSLLIRSARHRARPGGPRGRRPSALAAARRAPSGTEVRFETTFWVLPRWCSTTCFFESEEAGAEFRA